MTPQWSRPSRFMMPFYLLVAITAMPSYARLGQKLGPFTVSKWIGLVCFIWALLAVVPRRSSTVFNFHPLGLQALFLMQLLDVMASGLLRVETDVLTKWTAILMLYLTVHLALDSFALVRSSVLVLLGTMALSSVYVIRQYRSQAAVNEAFRSWGGLTGDPNFYALVVVLLIPAALVLLGRSEPHRTRLFCIVCMIAILPAFVIVGSRGGFLSLGVSLLWITAARRRLRYVIVFSVLLIPLLLLFPGSPLSRYLHPRDGDNVATDSRLLLWRTSWEIFKSAPLLGVGSEEYVQQIHLSLEGKRLGTYRTAHNTYLECAAQYGLAGLIPMVLLQLGLIRALGKVARRKHRDDDTAQMARAFQAGLAGWMVGSWFLSAWWIMAYWLMVFLAFHLIRSAATETTPAPAVLPGTTFVRATGRP